VELSDYSLSKSNLEEQFYFYKSLSDSVNIIKYGNELVSLLIDGYQTNKTDYLNQEIELGDYFLQTIPQLDEQLDSSTLEGLKNLSGNKDERIKMLGVRYDEDISGEINEIAWYFYESIGTKEELKKALQWSARSME